MANNYRGKKPLPVNSKGKLPSFPNKFPIRKDREKLINVQPTDRCVGTPTHSVSCRRIKSANINSKRLPSLAVRQVVTCTTDQSPFTSKE